MVLLVFKCTSAYCVGLESCDVGLILGLCHVPDVAEFWLQRTLFSDVLKFSRTGFYKKKTARVPFKVTAYSMEKWE